MRPVCRDSFRLSAVAGFGPPAVPRLGLEASSVGTLEKGNSAVNNLLIASARAASEAWLRGVYAVSSTDDVVETAGRKQTNRITNV